MIKLILLLALIFSLIPFSEVIAQQENTKEIEIIPTDDAYVIADLNDLQDAENLRTINTGDLNFLKVWHASGIPRAEDKNIVTFAYLKFDLSELEQNQIVTANLIMYAQNLTFVDTPIAVDLQLASAAPWNESTLIFPDAPIFSGNILDKAMVTTTDWYEWSVTNPVKTNAGSELSLVVMLNDLSSQSENQVVFTSKESDDRSLWPKLVIETVVIEQPAEPLPDSLIYLIIAIIATIAGGGSALFFYSRTNTQRKIQTKPEHPLTILKRRLAKGEISKQEYEDIKKRLNYKTK